MIRQGFHKDTNHRASEFLINSIHFLFAILDFPGCEAMLSFICRQKKHDGSRMNFLIMLCIYVNTVHNGLH